MAPFAEHLVKLVADIQFGLSGQKPVYTRQYLNGPEAAEYIGVHHNTLRNWGRNGRIPEYRHPVNNYRLFKVSDLDKLLKKTEQSATKKSRKPR